MHLSELVSGPHLDMARGCLLHVVLWINPAMHFYDHVYNHTIVSENMIASLNVLILTCTWEMNGYSGHYCVF